MNGHLALLATLLTLAAALLRHGALQASVDGCEHITRLHTMGECGGLDAIAQLEKLIDEVTAPAIISCHLISALAVERDAERECESLLPEPAVASITVRLPPTTPWASGVNFKVDSVSGDSVSGGAKVNRELFALFGGGQKLLLGGECSKVWPMAQQVVKWSQGTLRHAYKAGAQSNISLKKKAKGAFFAAAMLPLMFACSKDDPTVIYKNMRIGATSMNQSAVKAAIEGNYACLQIKCLDEGDICDASEGTYYAGAAPCDETHEAIAAYVLLLVGALGISFLLHVGIFLCVTIGLLAGVVTCKLIKYFTSFAFGPVKPTVCSFCEK